MKLTNCVKRMHSLIKVRLPPISSPVIKPKIKVHQSASTPAVKKEYDRLKPVKDLNIDDVITIRVFFEIGKGKNFRVDGGLIDLIVEYLDEGKVLAAITTQLPKEFSINTETLNFATDDTEQ